MAIKSAVQKAVAAWEKANPTYKGKVKFGSANRTWEEQLGFIIERPTQYKNIVANFKKKNSVTDLPAKKHLTDDQLKWWQTEIMKQAGKSPGFPHVGGKAVDIQNVKALGTDGKTSLQAALKKAGYKVLLEKVDGSSTKYGVSISQANVFHVTK